MSKALWEFYVAFRRDDELQIRSLLLARDVQSELTGKFTAMAADFLEQRTPVIYNGDYKAGEESILLIKQFSLPSVYIPTTKAGLPEQHLKKKDISPVTKFVAVFGATSESNKPKIVFQRMSETNVLRTGGRLIFSNDTLTKLVDPGLTIQDRVTAIVLGGDLYFESLRAVSGFIDITPYLMEASSEEMDKFSRSDQVAVEDKKAFEKEADSWIRKKIHMILRSDVLRRNSAKSIAEQARKRGITIPLISKDHKQAIQIPTDKVQAKRILQFLSEDILDSPLSNRVYMTNSKTIFKTKAAGGRPL